MARRIILNEWQEFLEEALDTASYRRLKRFYLKEFKNHTVFPEKKKMYEAFNFTPYHRVKVVILGEEPYNRAGLAHGAAFSVLPDAEIPPILMNIFKELKDDLGIDIPDHGYLKEWAQNGVFLMNSILTAREGERLAHKGQGWENVTDLAIKRLNTRDQPCVFILWGSEAAKKMEMIDTERHTVILAPSPSSKTAENGFFGSKPFSKANAALERMGVAPVDWNLSPRAELDYEAE